MQLWSTVYLSGFTQNLALMKTFPVCAPHPASLSPYAQAVLRIHFIEAQDVLGKDKFMGGLIKGKSDPYGVIQVGTQQFQSKVIHDTLNPRWNEVYEVS